MSHQDITSNRQSATKNPPPAKKLLMSRMYIQQASGAWWWTVVTEKITAVLILAITQERSPLYVGWVRYEVNQSKWSRYQQHLVAIQECVWHANCELHSNVIDNNPLLIDWQQPKLIYPSLIHFRPSHTTFLYLWLKMAQTISQFIRIFLIKIERSEKGWQ